MFKESVYQEDATVLNLSAPSNLYFNICKEKTELTGEINKSTIVFEELQVPQ